MSIGFHMQTPEDIRTKCEKMTDRELIEFGKTVKGFAKPRPGQGADEGWMMQLRVAREEWRRRHPKD
jgi:hypothetical protein